MTRMAKNINKEEERRYLRSIIRVTGATILCLLEFGKKCTVTTIRLIIASAKKDKAESRIKELDED